MQPGFLDKQQLLFPHHCMPVFDLIRMVSASPGRVLEVKPLHHWGMLLY